MASLTVRRFSASATRATTGAPRPRRVTRVSASTGAREPTYNIHGRHVVVTPELDQHIRHRISLLLHQMSEPQWLESEGGIREVEVSLMNSQCEVDLRPSKLNKHLHDTYLQGELRGVAQGAPDALSNFEQAVDQLEKKWHKWSAVKTVKRDQRHPPPTIH